MFSLGGFGTTTPFGGGNNQDSCSLSRIFRKGVTMLNVFKHESAFLKSNHVLSVTIFKTIFYFTCLVKRRLACSKFTAYTSYSCIRTTLVDYYMYLCIPTKMKKHSCMHTKLFLNFLQSKSRHTKRQWVWCKNRFNNRIWRLWSVNAGARRRRLIW